ncbi:serine/threonine-protein kinase Nek10-like [Liolophura sinensis]|uniref:serine/threonine-protein kinase Nek10-like n=1 Tax=Liolophura sinensis TaxID=3198878 RepID=UPI003158E6E0
MPSQGKNGCATHPGREEKDLHRLLDLIRTPVSKQQLPSIEYRCSYCPGSLQWPIPQPKAGRRPSTETLALEQFSLTYKEERAFSLHERHKDFCDIFSNLVKQRLCCLEWISHALPENILRVLVCLRIMMRDPSYQKEFFNLGGVKTLSEHLKKATDSYLTYGDGPYVVDILKEITNIYQKLSALVEQREWLVACGAHQWLVLLLTARDPVVLHCSLYALISLAQSGQPRKLIGELNSIEVLLTIIQEYDTLTKKLAANLLRLLCADPQSKEMVKVYDGVPILLSQLHSDNAMLLWHVVWCLVLLAEDPDFSNDIRLMGGIPLLLSLLHERKFVSERNDVSGGPASAGLQRQTAAGVDESAELTQQQYSLKSACCACLTELVLNDTNAQQIAQANGVYCLGLLVLPQRCCEKDRKYVDKLQRNAFRALRFLFSMERNRRLFKRLFPPDLFAVFIDIGHYNKDLSAYKPLVEKINSLSKASIAEIRENIQATNQDKAPSHYIGEYAVFELLGSGAFGSVYKVKKRSAGQSFRAMKEINLQNSAFGKTPKERETSVGEVISELSIMKEQLKHPNIVRYYSTLNFADSEKLFIVMELIEGAPLGEHFTSLKEKGETFTESRIWKIFIQILRGLRYLHKEKRIVHRDLTPNNIMLGENDRVTITDFGLAKQKRSDCSEMTSVVGTILYSCPEIVQNLPYGEKADIWATGCILYQMCTLKPPFLSSNMLTLATKIVNAEYDPIPDGLYSSRIVSTVKRCITSSPEDRPDILELSGQLVDILLVHMDNMSVNQTGLERKLDRERTRTQKHFYEACRNMQNYHRLFLASQERYDKLVNLASSGGGASMKENTQTSEEVFFESESLTRKLTRGVLNSPTASINSSMLRIDVDDPEEQTNEQGWISDDDDSSPSSGSESRESSAGSERKAVVLSSEAQSTNPQPPGTPKSREARQSRRLPHSQCLDQLSVEIPNTVKYSRDSGISSGDPSPNNCTPGSSVDPTVMALTHRHLYQRSQSVTAVDNLVHCSRKSARRPNSATLTISPRKVRQISDPILQLLHQLHKILYISQLPPVLCPNPHRRAIEKFKRALFAPQSTSFNLKTELKKLLQGSRDIIDLNLGYLEKPGRRDTASSEPGIINADNLVTSNYDPDYKDVGISYEQMQRMIEGTLVESGYYDMSPARDRIQPLGPIGRVPSLSS